ncbi:hypothetical protein U1Q18_010923 [Sarracenia purpurea var. burkii]
MEKVNLRTPSGMAKIAGIGLCLGGAITIAFYRGPSLRLFNHHLLGPHGIEANQVSTGSSSREWIKGCFLMLTAVFFWGPWLVVQVYCQPIFGFVEGWCRRRWPQSGFIAREYSISTPFGTTFSFNFFRLVWRTTFVAFTTVIAALLPFFNDFLGLLGAVAFWPLTVYFPIKMYILQARIVRFSPNWIWLQLLSAFCLVVSLLAAAGSIQGLIKDVQLFKPFHSIS